MPNTLFQRIASVLILSFWLSVVSAQCGSAITTYPYVEDFETSAAWTTGGPACTPSNVVINDWVWGHPNKNVINSAGSGQKCWIVGDTVGWLYAYGDRGWVQSPCFNFTSVVRPSIQFKLFRESEYKYDGTVLQYSTNNGTTWTNVGHASDPTDCMDTNWYNYNNISNLGSYTGTIPRYGNNTYKALATVKEGWCGNIQPSHSDTSAVHSSSTCQGGNGQGHWVTAKHCMPYLAGQSQVIFRFAFGAGTSCNNFNGFAFDSVAIGEGTNNTASISSSCVSTTQLNFIGSTNLCADTFHWDFGDPGSGASNTVVNAVNTSHTFSAPGTYTVTLTVRGGPCNAPGTATKVVHILGITPVVTPDSCHGSKNGTATAVISTTSAAGPYTYAWSTSPIQTRDTATGLAQGTYTVTVATTNACSATASATITQPAALSHSVAVIPASCGAATGAAVITESGGTAIYSYLWSNSLGSTDSIHGVAPGSYTLTVTDSHGCHDTVPVTIGSGGSITASAVSTNVLCHGQSTGSITVTVVGGSSPYTYHWTSTDSSNTGTHNNLAAGVYIITVTDQNGCSTIVRDTIRQSTALTHTYTSVQTSCGTSNGSAIVTVSGGTPAYSYFWNGGQGTADSIYNVAAGSYTCMITDANGCHDSAVVSISNSGGVVASLSGTTDATCHGSADGSITINASSGTAPYEYHWSPTDSSTINVKTGLSAGTYTVIVTDVSGCLSTVSASVSQPATLSHTITIGATTCGLNNGYALVLESGGTPGYTYLWTSGLGSADSFTTGASGIDTLFITDSRGCLDTAIVTIAATPPLTATISHINVTCYDSTNGTFIILATGGTTPYTYHWGSTTTGINTQTGFAAGTYTMTVSDAGSCSVTLIDSITQPSAILVLPIDTNVTCPGGSDGSIHLSVSGGTPGYSYIWSGTSQTTQVVTGLSATTYQVTVTDSKGCQKDTFTTLTSPAPFVINKSTIPDSCSYNSNGSANIVVTGATPGYKYKWSTGDSISAISNLSIGVYHFTVTDTLGCLFTDTLAVTSPLPISLTPGTTSVHCYNDSNGTAAISASGGTPGYTYLWNTGANTDVINNLKPGSYAVTVTDNNLCTVSLTSIVVDNPTSLSAYTSDTPQACLALTDGSAIIHTSGGTPVYSYQWAIGGTDSIINNLSAGTYLVTVTDANGCLYPDSVVVSLSPPLILDTIVVQPTCAPFANGSIKVNVSGGNPLYSYIWNRPGVSSLETQLAPGSYSVTVTDSRGCTSSDSFFLSYTAALSVEAGIDDTIDLGNQAILTATVTSTSSVSYVWSPDYHISCNTCVSTDVAPYQTLTYMVSVTDATGCTATDSVTVHVNSVHDLYVPNAFTPNGDGNNDYFAAFGNKKAWKYVHARIFNRWGELVFESNDIDFKWDGKFKGEFQDPGVYVYLIDVTFIDDYSIGKLKGSVTLIR
jgi:gliding motility-associated-like protein